MGMAISKHTKIGVFLKSVTLILKLRGENTMENNQMLEQSINPSERLLIASEIAFRLHISRSRAYGLMASGSIRSIHIGRSRRVRQIDLERFINSNTYGENNR
jgi:excisionase family DNA binding protein